MALKGAITRISLSLSMFSTLSFGQSVNGADYNNPTAGPPASFFAAASTMPVSALSAAVARASVVPPDATYPIGEGSIESTIHSDWVSFSSGASYSFVADMDVDCDGIDYKCQGNTDGQTETNWGALAAYEVPWIVIPQTFQDQNSAALPGNNIAAVICDGKMYYGILGDCNGDSPEVTGEASWLMARTCFGTSLNGNSGHTQDDVTYIIFTGKNAVLPSSALNNNYITNFSTLRSMGDALVNALASQLGISGSSGPTTTHSPSTTSTRSSSRTTTSTSSTPASTDVCSFAGGCEGDPCPSGGCADQRVCVDGLCTSNTCTWAGHCEGATCASNDDCADSSFCDGGLCTSGSCEWAGHCEGAGCADNSGCGNPTFCDAGICSIGCSWIGHCTGASCLTSNNCANDCVNGLCT